MMALARTSGMMRGLSKVAGQCRMSSNIALSVHDKTGVATLSMQKKPVNSLSLEMLQDLDASLDKLHAEKCKGLILTSSVPKIFSAGLDILEMYQPQEDRLRAFWGTLQDVFLKLYGSKLVTIAAINGNSPAGGCLLSLLCDVRIMQEGPFAIGLNETKLGIVAPFWFQDAMLNTIGFRECEKALMLGHMYPQQEALQVGLIDKIVPADQMQEAIEAEMKKWLSIPAAARVMTKHQMRNPALEKLKNSKEKDIDFFVSFITQAPVQKAMGVYMEMLKAASMKKAAKDKA